MMLLLKLLLPLMPLTSSAFILKPATLVQKMVENSGSGVYQIEVEVQFPVAVSSSQEPLVLRETWQVESDNKMRLTVNGTKELANKIHWVFVYENGQRYFVGPGGRSSQAEGENFIEKYFHFRKADRLETALTRMKIVPSSLFVKRAFKMGKDPDVVSDPHLRLARVGGVITYALGLPTDVGAEPQPNFYVEQDQFVLRKFRLPSQVEVSAENFTSFAKGLNFPRHRSVRWEDKQVSLQTIHVQAKSEKTVSSNLEPSTSMDVPDLGASKNLVEEFYQRFR